MRSFTLTGLFAALLTCTCALHAQDTPEIPEMPPPQKEHEWLQRFVGEWESEAEVFMQPGQPPLKGRGTERARMLGGFWMIAEGESEMMGMPFTHILTLGYDPDKNKYVGTWIDSMSGYLWKYEGTVDSTGNVLTLETQGPCPQAPGTLSRFREVMEFKSENHRVFTSSIQGDDGEWTAMVTVHSWRRK